MAQERARRFLEELPRIQHDLPYSPGLLQKLFTQTSGNSLASLEEISETIAQDQGLTARILTVANSAFYGLQAKVTTVSRAMAVLGLKEVRAMVLALGVKDIAKGLKNSPIFDLREYWRHQLMTASAAEIIAVHAGTDYENMFTAGLLHDLGKVLIALHSPDDWRAIIMLSAAEDLPHARSEERYWGLEHGLVGSLVLSSWDLPKALTEPINWHHSPNQAPEFRRQAEILCVANALAHELSGHKHPIAGPWRKILEKSGFEEAVLKEEIQRAFKDKNLSQLLNQLV